MLTFCCDLKKISLISFCVLNFSIGAENNFSSDDHEVRSDSEVSSAYTEDLVDLMLSPNHKEELFDPELDILLVDYDETMVGNGVFIRGIDRPIRSNGGIIELFEILRKQYPGSIFIYSTGAMFALEYSRVGISLQPIPTRFMNQSFDRREKFDFNTVVVAEEDFLPERTPPEGIVAQVNVYYYAELSAFHICSKGLEIPSQKVYNFWESGRKNTNGQTFLEARYSLSRDIKGLMLESVLLFIYKISGRPIGSIRNIHFIDDRSYNITSMDLACHTLNEKGLIQGFLNGIHVPLKSERENTQTN
ncbi:MAG: hypothetical protein KBD31_04605 [Proteobacteria bacterium]|nr:hypothetical protein [Pseudomonadota bacterium]